MVTYRLQIARGWGAETESGSWTAVVVGPVQRSRMRDLDQEGMQGLGVGWTTITCLHSH